MHLPQNRPGLVFTNQMRALESTSKPQSAQCLLNQTVAHFDHPISCSGTIGPLVSDTVMESELCDALDYCLHIPLWDPAPGHGSQARESKKQACERQRVGKQVAGAVTARGCAKGEP